MREPAARLRALALLAVVAAARASSLAGAGAVSAFSSARVLRYRVEGGTVLRGAPGPEVGYRLHAELAITALWPEHQPRAPPPDEFLLHFQLSDVRLLGRGTGRSDWEPRPSAWGDAASSFYAHWRRGAVVAAYLRADSASHELAYQRALLSLFQFQIIDGERNETDISGDCDVLYETVSAHEIRKIKRSCRWIGEDSEEEGEGAWSAAGSVRSRRVARYTFTEQLDALKAIAADEVHELTAGAGRADAALAGVAARAWVALRLRTADARRAATAPALHAAIDELPSDYTVHTLPLPAPNATTHHEESLEEALTAGGWGGDDDEESEAAAAGGAGAGRGGGARSARAALRLLPALCAAPAAALAAQLQRLQHHPHLTALVQLCGTCGTLSAHKAADTLLQLRADPALPLADLYLAALTLAPRPDEAVVMDVLEIATSGRHERVASAALLAAAAAAPRAAGGGARAGAAVRERALRGLSRCADDACRRLHALALGNLRRADTADALLELVERAAPAVALAAVDALAALPVGALPYARARRLLPVATNASRPLELRAAALDAALWRARHLPLALADWARALHALGPGAPEHELRRLFWQRLHETAQGPGRIPAATRALLRALRADPQLYNWHAQAHDGTSSVLSRSTGWAAGGWQASLDSQQAAARRQLRRGHVRLLLTPDDVVDSKSSGDPLEPRALLAEGRAPLPPPPLGVALWARGLAAMAGDAAGDEEPEEPAAGLDLAVAGVRLAPITLFEGQGELLGHVWAGTGSTPTPVLRALVMLPRMALHLPLLLGPHVTVSAAACGVFALDAHAAVSLWSRTARAELALRAGLAAEARASLNVPGASLRAADEAEAEPRLTIAADLDFYDGVELCVRTDLDDFHHTRNVSLESELGARHWRVRRGRGQRVSRAGRTLSLGAQNDRACAR